MDSTSHPTAKSSLNVADLYSHSVIFVTGGTGTLGKVLMYKILASFPKIKQIYLLIRHQKGAQVKDRLEKLLYHDQVFKDIPESMLRKVRAIEGDVSESRLGLSNEDWELLSRSVDVIFHSAANIKFNANLKKTLTANVVGTRSVIELAREMPNLKAFVHISTAYCQCHLEVIEEKIYPDASLNAKVLDQLLRLDDEELEKMTSSVIYPRQNNYVFSKAMAEQILHDEGKGLPVVIVRPTMVVAAAEEPFPGWVENVEGPASIIALTGTGILRSLYIKGDYNSYIIPVDYVINAIIVSAHKMWITNLKQTEDIGVAYKDPVPIKVYHCLSSYSNHITYRNMMEWGYPYIIKYPMERLFWYPGGNITSYKIVETSFRLIENWIPAYLIDAALCITGRKTFMVKLIRKMSIGLTLFTNFFNGQWLWKDENTRALFNSLSPSDMEMFKYEVDTLNWKTFLEDSVKGTRKFVLKYNDDTLESSRKHLRTMFILHVSTLVILYSLAVICVYYFIF